MSIKIPNDATVVNDKRLTLVRVLSTLTAEDGRLDQLKDGIKGTLKQKKAAFAQSDLVVAQLRSNPPKAFVVPRMLYALVKSKRITMEQFLDVLCIRSSLLPPILSGEEIKAISEVPVAQGSGTGGALFTEFKPEVRVDFDKIEAAILEAAVTGVP